MKFTFFNDSKKDISVHTATFIHGCKGSGDPIKPLEERTFILPEGTYPWVKTWGNMILVSPTEIEEEKTDD